MGRNLSEQSTKDNFFMVFCMYAKLYIMKLHLFYKQKKCFFLLGLHRGSSKLHKVLPHERTVGMLLNHP